DTLDGGADNDRLYGEGGNDLLIGGEGNDRLNGGVGADSLIGDAGNDRLYGGEGSDTLVGESGVDWLSGDKGDDILIGGTGNDQLRGGVGSDIYHIARGDGGDRITDLGGQDRVLFDGSIAHDQLWFSRSSDNLKVSLIGTDNHIQISDWFSNMESRIEVFEIDDGQFLYDQQVQQLVDAMAAFAPPASGQLNLADEYKTSLEPVIAASWLSS
ncbi:MAG: calcium-binding protein, partial [Candidatus Sedimenticola sp. (ex Thyasira tokunagai)]